MEYKNILYQEKDGLIQITINRPDKLNALNDPLINELFDVFNGIRFNPNVGAVIITGSVNRRLEKYFLPTCRMWVFPLCWFRRG